MAGTIVRKAATTAKAIAGCQLPSVDFQVPIPDCWVSVIERILVKLENRQLPIGGDPIGKRVVEGERESWEVNWLVSEHRQSADVSSRVWYGAEISVTMHDADFSGTKSPGAGL